MLDEVICGVTEPDSSATSHLVEKLLTKEQQESVPD